MINAWATVALFVGLAGSIAFLVPYLATVKGWWREEHVLHVVSFSFVLFEFFVLYVLRSLVPPDIFQWIRLVMLWQLSLTVVWRALIFLRGLRRRRRALREVH